MITAIIPCYNDFATIEKVLEKTIKYVDMVVVIDDGSNPPLNSILFQKTMFLNQIVLLRNEKKQGYGNALIRGLIFSYECGAKFAITLDADLQHDPDEIPKFLKILLYSNTDIVLGNRFKGNSNVPTVDALLIKIISKVFSIIVKRKIEDALCGFRAYNLEIFNNVNLETMSGDMGFPIEMLAIAIRNGRRIQEVPVKVTYNELSKRGLIRKFTQLLEILRGLIRVALLMVNVK